MLTSFQLFQTYMRQVNRFIHREKKQIVIAVLALFSQSYLALDRVTRNSLESLEFEKRVKTLLTSLLATGKFKKKSSEGNLINITLHPRQTKKSEET